MLRKWNGLAARFEDFVTAPDRRAHKRRSGTARRSPGPTTFAGDERRVHVGPGSSDDTIKILSRTATGQEGNNSETRRNHKDNRYTEVSINASVIRDTNGTIVGASKIVRDISDDFRAESDLLKLAKSVISIQEEERSRLARELHDGIGQELVAMTFTLKRLEPVVHGEDARRLLDSLQDSMNKLSADLHSKSWELRSLALTEFGLCRAIENHLIDWSARFGLPHEFLCNCVDRVAKLIPETEWAAYRVVQEALTNVVKHANSATVSVTVEITLHTLRLTIADDGKGFDPASIEPNATRHLGIRGMHERLGLVGGKLHIDSVLGHGTTISIDIPLRETVAAVA
jgi:signal transduction histidine kinase